VALGELGTSLKNIEGTSDIEGDSVVLPQGNSLTSDNAMRTVAV
jgi:hypothetical protein